MNSQTAILLFTQTAQEDCKNKHFQNGVELFSILNSQTLKTVKNSQLPFFIFTEKEQKGKTFGERFTNAITQVFKKGYTQIITIGNDCPQLKSEQLIQAAENFLMSKTTIGPTIDGGFYLLAFHKSLFDKNDFLNLPWQKKTLRRELIKLLKSKYANLIFQKCYNDLDNLNDINYYLSHRNSISEDIFCLLQASPASTPFFPVWNIIKNSFTSTSFNKGSPFS